MFIDIRNLQERRQERDSQFEGVRDIRNGYLFEVNGSIEGDRDGLVWFRARDGNSEPFQVFYNGVIGDIRANMFVKIERNPKDPARWQVIEFDTGIYFDDQSSYEQLPSLSAIPAKEDYEWPPGFPGAKALNIFPRAITDFAVRPTSPASMKARVYSGIYPGATNYARFQGPVNTKDFTADVPGAGLARLAAISIDNTGTLNYTNGTTFVDGLPMPDASLPAVPASQMLISAVRLVNGMTAIEESNFDLEMRPLMANGTVNVKVSEVWESDFGAVALQADANGDVGIGTTGPDARLDVLDTGGAQLRLTFEDGVKFADLILDTNHDLTITPSSTGQIILQPTTDSTDFFQVLDADGGLPILNVDSTNERVGIGPVTPPEVDFHLSRDGSGTSFITEKYGGAPDMIARRANGTLAAPSAIGANVQLFGFGVRPWFNDTAAFSAGSIGNFTFNSDEAISSTTKGTRFTVGTTENGNNSVSERMRINNVGDMGVGTTSPQGRLHTYETISGFIVWEFDGLDGTVRTIIPNGTGDALYRLIAIHVLRDSAAAVASGIISVSNGASVNLIVGGNTVRLRVNADGSVDVARTAGTDTIKVALLLRWL